MQVVCAKCNHVLEYSGARPSFCAYCGQSLGPPPQLETTAALDPGAATLAPDEPGAETAQVPKTVGGYRLIRSLGSGGMGTVYEAEDSASGRRVALKIISTEYAASLESVDRFRQEGRLASAISHPRCVFVLAADEDAGRPYIAMELMPGRTLNDLVREQGPLSVEQALVKILDVIEGLQEAHRLGLVHRDVKPSNCFLEADSRVKVGDFGLSKSLAGDSNLTKTGTFLGTPLFSAPEQIRLEKVDQQADVYSVAATLYFLLTGQAPFQTGDAMATMARIVADDPPPMRSMRPELPAALDRVVLRGLERDRGRRWKNLDELRQALLPFLPGRLSIGGLGWRFVAYLVDAFVLWFINLVVSSVITVVHFGSLIVFLDPDVQRRLRYDPMLLVLGFVPVLLGIGYFALFEGVLGWSPGKRLLRLQVCRADSGDPPGLRRGLVRAGVFVLLRDLQLSVFWTGWFIGLVRHTDPDAWMETAAADPGAMFQDAVPWNLIVFLMWILGKALLLSSMRTRNGYRGLHELVSGTRVLQMAAEQQRRLLWARGLTAEPLLLARPDGLPEHIGAYTVLGALRHAQDEQVLVAEEPGLKRQVWIWLRPMEQPALPAARREIGRTGRLRWLAGGTQDNMQWDAFLAPRGRLLIDWVRKVGRLPWPESQMILGELVEELAAAADDQTLPFPLTLQQVWVQPNEHALLLDMPISEPHWPAAPAITKATANAPMNVLPIEQAEAQHAANLLGQVAALTLEGEPRPEGIAPRPVRAPLPASAAAVLRRWIFYPYQYRNVKTFRADLQALRQHPAEVTWEKRLRHVLVLTALHFIGLVGCILPISMFLSPTVFTVMERANAIAIHLDALGIVEEGSTKALAAGILNPDPLARLTAVAQWSADKELASTIAQNLLQLQQERDAQLSEVSWGLRSLHPWLAHHRDTSAVIDVSRPYRETGETVLAFHAPSTRQVGAKEGLYFQCVPLGFWFISWILWALVTRGGISYRLAGINLVRADGRRASRLRCAGRAFLVWAPFFGLLVLAAALDAAYWSVWHRPMGRAPHRWLETLSTVSWWSAWLLLAGYVVLALRYPQRSLHDRLVGTYLVPR